VSSYTIISAALDRAAACKVDGTTPTDYPFVVSILENVGLTRTKRKYFGKFKTRAEADRILESWRNHRPKLYDLHPPSQVVLLEVESHPQVYAGVETGQTEFYAKAKIPLGLQISASVISVLGRGLSAGAAVGDWNRRARLDGHKVDGRITL